MDLSIIILLAIILAAYGFYVYRQGHTNGTADGALSVLIIMFKENRIDKAYVMKNLPSLTDEEFHEIFILSELED
jgi:hypothetical protein